MLRAELSNMIALAERLLAQGEHGVLSTLFSANGSTYRPLGSMMVSAFPLVIAGGVSGGCLEQHVARAGHVRTQHRPSAMLRFDTDPDDDDAGHPVLGCGGAIEVLVERLTPDHLAFLRRLSLALDSDAPSTAACVVEAPSEPSIKVSRHWPDDGAPNGAVVLLDGLLHRCTVERRSLHGALGPSLAALAHYVPALTRLVIFGAGDDARPLSTLARSLGWRVTVADRRTRLATRTRFPEADDVVLADWATAVGRVTFTPRTAVVLMTHSFPDDVALLPLLRERPMLYLGSLGPEHRREWLLDAVAGHQGERSELDARVRGPIGLDLGDRSPSGIAVSIVAEILACLNGRDASPLSGAPLAPRAETDAAHA